MSDPFFDGDWSDSSDKPLYTKIPQGEVKLRVLSKALIGWEGWFQNKPVRFRADYKISPAEYDKLDRDNFNPDKAKWRQFGVCVVYNYTDEAVQYWQFTQKQIKDQLIAYATDPDWGDLTQYDIKVKREGERIETKYTITPLPKKPVSAEVSALVADKGLNPEQIFNDAKNADNIKNFQESKATEGESSEDMAKNIPF